MEVTEIGGVRYYLDNHGKHYRSVTGILSATRTDKDIASLDNWKKKKGHVEADRIFNDACRRGSFTHACAENYLLGKDLVLDYEPGLPYWESLRPALRPITDVVAMEIAISHPLGYGGRFDCFCTYKGIEETIVDFKTSDKKKPRQYVTDYCYQLAAYAGGIYHTLGYKVHQGVIIIGIKNRTAQTIVLNRDELRFYWKLWEERVKRYHDLQIEKNLKEVA